MSLIATSKYGDCTRCTATDTACKKRGKDLVCLSCCKIEDTQKQIGKANERNKVRSLNTYQREVVGMDSMQSLILDIDRVFSLVVRLSAMQPDGRCECFTCGRKMPYQKIQAGHYISRSNLATRFLLKNTRCQCPTCNINLHGNIPEYTKRLDQEQLGLSEWLQEQGRTVEKPSIGELKATLFDFQQKLNTLQKIKLK